MKLFSQLLLFSASVLASTGPVLRRSNKILSEAGVEATNKLSVLKNAFFYQYFHEMDNPSFIIMDNSSFIIRVNVISLKPFSDCRRSALKFISPSNSSTDIITHEFYNSRKISASNTPLASFTAVKSDDFFDLTFNGDSEKFGLHSWTIFNIVDNSLVKSTRRKFFIYGDCRIVDALRGRSYFVNSEKFPHKFKKDVLAQIAILKEGFVVAVELYSLSSTPLSEYIAMSKTLERAVHSVSIKKKAELSKKYGQ